MFYINKETPLTDALLHKLINQFQTTELPKLKRWGDYTTAKSPLMLSLLTGRMRYSAA